MKKCLCLSITVLLGIFALPALAKTSALQLLHSKLTHYQSYHANFVQLTQHENALNVKRSSGEVWLQHPDKFRWQSKQPNQQILIANGNTLWIYDVDLQQVTKRKIGTGQHVSPVEILMGNREAIAKEFLVAYKNHWFILTARSQQSQLEQIKIKFIASQLRYLQYTNRLGQTSKITFSHIKINPTLDSNLFDFKPPVGVDVVNEN